jgi:hypothetical protein
MGVPTVKFAQQPNPAPKITASPQGLTSVVRYRMAWTDAFTFVNEILGILDGEPWKWPASPNMRAYNAEIEPIGVDQNVKQQLKPISYGSSPGEFYEYALVTVTFGSQATLATMPYSPNGITGIPVDVPPADQFDPETPVEMSSYQVTYGTEMIKIPGGALEWSTQKSDGSPQTIPAGVRPPDAGSVYFRVPTFDLNMVLHNCIKVDFVVVRERIGKVNSVKTLGCERETLLFSGLNTQRREMSDGTGILDVTLNYKWRATSWNVALGTNGSFYRYVNRDGGNPIYQLADIDPRQILPKEVRWAPQGFNGIPGR